MRAVLHMSQAGQPESFTISLIHSRTWEGSLIGSYCWLSVYTPGTVAVYIQLFHIYPRWHELCAHLVCKYLRVDWHQQNLNLAQWSVWQENADR
ncbi:hypothetical protein XENTR_v10022367 [Xenopus tropicalis]|nr:hypothetical protein XENTR_v10022367 [Xenopus tropicalis]